MAVLASLGRDRRGREKGRCKHFHELVHVTAEDIVGNFSSQPVTDGALLQQLRRPNVTPGCFDSIGSF